MALDNSFLDQSKNFLAPHHFEREREREREKEGKVQSYFFGLFFSTSAWRNYINGQVLRNASLEIIIIF